ncbi:hypothetical protein AMK27_38200 [Streptomyces sp. CB02009]|uniref:hypothetical protein n=1 Tax=Streptomyces sp. CB02009 TaxID=1703938 RepID=UPI00093EB706|nr:hypothetical protein [Streptomyces sp. CB02009]OKJ48609.1 hypothetical protein AMK27_38200 [Streptomyces sp. CB02009]
METSSETGVIVAWMRCAGCAGVGRVILASESMAAVLADAGAHVAAAHPDERAAQLLAMETADAAVFRGPDPRPDPAAWVTVLNKKLKPDF